MTVTVVLATPPREGLVLGRLVEESPLTAGQAADLYTAMLEDVIVAADRAGGQLLVNYQPDELLPAEYRTDTPAEAAVRAVVRPILEDPDAVRFEQQVGSNRSARVGNTVTHLLREEDASSVQVVDPATPLLARSVVDSASMKLRRSDVVLGPAPNGRVYAACFGEPIDFEDAYAAPAVQTLTARAMDESLDVDFLEMLPVVESEQDLATVVSLLRARASAKVNLPTHTLEVVDELGLEVDGETGRVVVAE